MESTTSIQIILIEDDPGHARLLEKNLRRADIAKDIHIFGDGRAFLKCIHQTETPCLKAVEPPVILLDLNLPFMSGFDVLQHLKSNQATKHIPVIILTTTDNPAEIERCYRIGCNFYITKPVNYEQFGEIIKKLGVALSIIKMPKGKYDG